MTQKKNSTPPQEHEFLGLFYTIFDLTLYIKCDSVPAEFLHKQFQPNQQQKGYDMKNFKFEEIRDASGDPLRESAQSRHVDLTTEIVEDTERWDREDAEFEESLKKIEVRLTLPSLTPEDTTKTIVADVVPPTPEHRTPSSTPPKLSKVRRLVLVGKKIWDRVRDLPSQVLKLTKHSFSKLFEKTSSGISKIKKSKLLKYFRIVRKKLWRQTEIRVSDAATGLIKSYKDTFRKQRITVSLAIIVGIAVPILIVFGDVVWEILFGGLTHVQALWFLPFVAFAVGCTIATYRLIQNKPWGKIVTKSLFVAVPLLVLAIVANFGQHFSLPQIPWQHWPWVVGGIGGLSLFYLIFKALGPDGVKNWSVGIGTFLVAVIIIAIGAVYLFNAIEGYTESKRPKDQVPAIAQASSTTTVTTIIAPVGYYSPSVTDGVSWVQPTPRGLVHVECGGTLNGKPVHWEYDSGPGKDEVSLEKARPYPNAKTSYMRFKSREKGPVEVEIRKWVSN